MIRNGSVCTLVVTWSHLGHQHSLALREALSTLSAIFMGSSLLGLSPTWGW